MAVAQQLTHLEAITMAGIGMVDLQVCLLLRDVGHASANPSDILRGLCLPIPTFLVGEGFSAALLQRK